MKKLTFIVWSSYAPIIAQGLASRSKVPFRLFTTKCLEDPKVAENAAKSLEDSSLIFLFRTSDKLWDQFEKPLAAIKDKIPIVSVGYDPRAFLYSTVSLEASRRAYSYLLAGGAYNSGLLIDFLLALNLGKSADDTSVKMPLPLPFEGFWHPHAPAESFPYFEDFIDWYEDYRAEKGLCESWVGLICSRHHWANRNNQVEKDLVAAIEARGLSVVPTFSNALKDSSVGAMGASLWAQYAFLDKKGQSRVDAIVKLTNFFGAKNTSPKVKEENFDSPAQESARVFSQLGVPIFQPILSSSKTIAQWEAEPLGLTSEVSWAVAMPEFEGVIEPFYLGGVTSETVSPYNSGSFSSLNEGSLERRESHPERLKRFASRLARWISLRRKPTSQRKIAFILHNNPCASVEASVGGAAKLDSIESLSNILKAMKENGYDIEAPQNGKELIDNILGKKAVSEFRWTTVGDIVASGGALDLIPTNKYLNWFSDFPLETQSRISDAWGAPPGREQNGIPAAMVHEDKIVITGIKLGNVTVSVQPKRGCAGARCDGTVCKILHDPSVPPPHQYIATYRWLQDEFGADAIVHVGTHGNLEFLPGKSVGLSEKCLPDLCLFEVPHIYIYNSDNPAEGVIAKRRSYAEICDHLQTVLATGKAGEDFTLLEDYLGQWEKAVNTSPLRARELETLILEEMEKVHLADPKLDESFSLIADDFSTVVRRAHEAISLVTGTSILDGMHIFGELPTGERLADFIYSILRFDTGPASLRRALARALGIELELILKDPAAFNHEQGQSNAKLIAQIDTLALEVIKSALNAPIDQPKIISIQSLREKLADKLKDPLALGEMEKPLERLAGIRKRLVRTKEIPSFLSAIKGNYLEPGPSGIITRGQEDIIPTGRNFFTLDPRRLPTPAAALVGRELAKALLSKHVAQEGHYPENVALFWMCNDLMWADGEGMGQILYLMGAIPLWTPDGRVSDIEVIPLKDLGRPRIDVTIRVSGLLRDSFPGAMDLVDRAVCRISALEEDIEQNFVRKHTLERMASYPKDKPDAFRKATFRIFSAMPGVYQAGVSLAVAASAWKTEKDLTDIFIHWNSYAYGEGVKGVASPRSLEAALSTVDVTWNKVVSDEHDLLGCCGYYSSHGGLTNAAKTLSRNRVSSYYGDTRDPTRPQVRQLADEIKRVVRAKLLNQNWIDGMKRHGYKGAGDIAKRAGRLYGWEASTGEVDDWIFDEMTKTFILDKENREFFQENNPWALEEIARRLLEAMGRGLWNPTPEIKEELKNQYLQIEGWIEERTGENTGQFQGGAIDIVTADEVALWKKALESVKAQED
ncbi:MAG: cobaltochelatase subunit CobN [Deltaproteobacteria bacterium]|nr:cobaltochelatase subunit CobN [Deltaproteobacteria bacterium]